MAFVDTRPLAAPHLESGGAAPSPPLRGLGVDALVLLGLGALLAGLIAMGRHWAAPLITASEIDLSLSSLPKYALMSLSRGLAAYALSLLFTLFYGSLAAHSRRAERVMIPILDILQGIPVLSFLPGLVIALVALFPHSNVGLELACVLLIFTGQVWNMTFSFYGSLRAIPQDLREAARIYRLDWWRRLSILEVPAAMIGLVWNSMMSVAGGWFFITVVESFKLRGLPYRLPGIGSYMSAAQEAGDARAMVGACVTMVVIIVLLDQLLWRPLLAWSQRFKLEETAIVAAPAKSPVYDLLRRSWLWARLRRRGRHLLSPAPRERPPGDVPLPAPPRAGGNGWGDRLEGLLLGGLAIASLSFLGWGAYHFAVLLQRLAWSDWAEIFVSLLLTTLRVLAAVALGAAWTIPFGIWIGRSPRAARFLQPVIQALASFPMPMLFPLVAAWLAGLGMGLGLGAIGLMLIGTQWYLLFNVVAGAVAIPGDLVEASSVYGLRGLARFRLVYLPGIFPFLVTGLVTAAGGAWNASIISEWVPFGGGQFLATRGIGSLIARAFDTSNDALLATSVLVLSAALVVINRYVWKPLYRMADTRFAMNR